MIREQINRALKQALQAGDKRRINTLRLINAAIQDRCMALGANGEGSLSESDIVELLQQMVEQRRNTAAAYERYGRLELAQQELEEIEVISAFLPQTLDEPETRQEMPEGCEGDRRVGSQGCRPDNEHTESALQGPDEFRQGQPVCARDAEISRTPPATASR